MKKIIILKNNGGRLANQLWLFANIYAYCLEKKYLCENRSFFRYYQYFKIERPEGISKLFFHKKINESRIVRLLYSIYSSFIKILNKSAVIDDKGKHFILPPDKIENTYHERAFRMTEENNSKNFYFCGWLFRTPKGLEKHHQEIVKYFKPREEYINKIKNIIQPLRDASRYIIGVHIRHGDYKTWNGGKYYYSFEEVRSILDQYLKGQQNPNKVTFVLCSDEDIPDKVFSDLSYIKGLGSEIEDLYTLAATDKILGSNSSFGEWAAYYGNIPFIIFPEK
jgi:hypothetical protein